jgi:enamine deaminase RidA (YjgF/YER057c/UK114 family)
MADGPRHIQPRGSFESAPFGFTHVVTSPPGRLVFVSGQVALDAAMNPVGGDDLAAQAQHALENVGRALEAAGATPADVTMVRAYIVDFEPRDGGKIGAAFQEFFGTPPPASTWVGVTGLAVAGLRIEIEVYAVVPD